MKDTNQFFHWPLIALFLAIIVRRDLPGQDGITFIDNDFKSALLLAEEKNKLVFIDGYTTWCVPCKVMEEEVFIAQEVKEYFNQHFVNVRIDLEKGVGPILSARYQAEVLPAYFFVTSDETLIHQFSGLQKISDLMLHARTARDPSLLQRAWDMRYAEGDRKPAFLRKYAYSKYPSTDGLHQRLVVEYLDTQDDWSTEVNLRFIHHFIENVDSPMFDYLVDERDKFEAVIPPSEIHRSIDILVQNAIYNRQPPLSLKLIESLLERSYPNRGKKLSLLYRLNHFRKRNDYEQVAIVFNNLHSDFPADLSQDTLVQMANYFYKHVKAKSSLENAQEWMKVIVKSSKNPQHCLLAGNLAEKIGDDRGALKFYKLGFKGAKRLGQGQLADQCKTAIQLVKQKSRKARNPRV